MFKKQTKKHELRLALNFARMRMSSCHCRAPQSAPPLDPYRCDLEFYHPDA